MAESNKGCCPIGSEPYLATDYNPIGTEETIDDMKIYTVGKGEKALIFIYDIFGFNGGRTKLMCDQFADAGYLVVLPDFFRGDFWKKPSEFSGIALWLDNFPWKKLEGDLHKIVYPYLESKGVKKIGMIGCCWGCFVLFNACAEEKISIGINFHPTLKIAEESPEKLAEAVKCPQLVLSAGNDPEELKEGGSVHKILKAKLFGDKIRFRDFPDMIHGWVPRAPLDAPNNIRDVRLAMEIALDYLKQNF